jgi:precorrin-6B methylase 2
MRGNKRGALFFEVLYADPIRLREFLDGMAGAQMANFMAFARGFDFSAYTSLADMGGGGGYLAAQVTRDNPHMHAITFDLPAVAPIAKENIARMEVSDQVSIREGDFFTDDFPRADVITMGNILHDWGLEDKKTLMRKAFQALPKGGALVAIENIIDEDRSRNVFGLLMSLNMLIETEAGFDYSAGDFAAWAEEVGFSRTEVMPLAGPSSAAIAYK